MASLPMKQLPLIFLLLLFLSLRVQAKEEETTNVDDEEIRPLRPFPGPIKPHPKRPPKSTFEEKKPPGPKKPPKSTFEEKKPPYVLQPGGPLKPPKWPPKSTFEEKKPPYVLQPGKGPLRPPKLTSEEKKPAHALRPAVKPPKTKGLKQLALEHAAETIEDSKQAHFEHSVKPPRG